MPDKSRYDHELEISTPGAYGEGVSTRFDRMLSADFGGLLSVLRDGGVLRGKAIEVGLFLQIRNKEKELLAQAKVRGIYPGLLAISECFPAGWDLVRDAYGLPFTVDQADAPLTLEDTEAVTNSPIDLFLRESPKGTFRLETDESGHLCVTLTEPREPRKERRGGKLLTYSQLAIRRGRATDLFEALKEAAEATEEIQSNLVMDSV